MLSPASHGIRTTHGLERVRRGPPLSSVAYVYQGKVYDFLLRHSEPTADLRVGESAFHNLIRARYTVRERATGRSTQFLVTYGSEGALAGSRSKRSTSRTGG